MRRLLFLIALLGAVLSWTPAPAADVALTGATVAIPGGEAPTDPVPVIASPGVSFGLTVTPQGAPSGAPVILEVHLARPGEPLDAPLLRWMVAAVVGQPSDATWEFAYDWEVITGDWFMSVSYEGTELAKATFRVSAAAAQPTAKGDAGVKVQAGQTPAKPGQNGQAGSKESAGKQQPGAAAQPSAGKAKTPPAAQAGQAGQAQAPGRKAEPAPAASREQAAGQEQVPKKEQAKEGTPAATRQGQVQPPSPKPGNAPAPQAAPPAAAEQPSASRPAQAPAPRMEEPTPPRQERRVRVGGAPGSTVHVLVGGTYSEEARALWVAVFLRKNGVKACVREQDKGGRKLWAVVTGWTADQDEARSMQKTQTPVVGNIIILEMTVAELEKGLNCP